MLWLVARKCSRCTAKNSGKHGQHGCDVILGQDGSSQSQASDQVAMEMTDLQRPLLPNPPVLGIRQLWSMLGLLLRPPQRTFESGLAPNEYGNSKWGTNGHKKNGICAYLLFTLYTVITCNHPIYPKMVLDNLEPCAAKTNLRIRLDKTLQHIANMLARPPCTWETCWFLKSNSFKAVGRFLDTKMLASPTSTVWPSLLLPTTPQVFALIISALLRHQIPLHQRERTSAFSGPDLGWCQRLQHGRQTWMAQNLLGRPRAHALLRSAPAQT